MPAACILTLNFSMNPVKNTLYMYIYLKCQIYDYDELFIGKEIRI